ncbi:MAG: hypothetical protein A2934_03065 [Candidatus Sungbacteria bacterium RIFCSPLOWO2_01_FULL_47_10]|uniref:DUF2933 domain-containing protein n=1 Tax=Candidatus Sungbacteria bacterium RIFCSPLOWO2_01_FULL_47_10 TaxID=1802276 RepID=A0A1G2L8S2_9BACT|nr:MAG: hypothetical protein A2934_03065 [Candidatus Sungbacteria bacterium RIFCSPLOWO2_01_FULL_47_10]
MNDDKNIVTEKSISKKGFWRVLCCVAPAVVGIGFLALFWKGGSFRIWLFILLCPVLHFLLTRGHRHGENHKNDTNDS